MLIHTSQKSIQMKTILKFSLLFALLFTIPTACNKYVDGPKISLLTKKSRLANSWKIQAVTVNEVDVTALFTAGNSGYVLEIDKNETYKITGAFTDSGTWSLGEDKDDIYFKSSTPPSAEQSNRILRLKSKELWLRQTAPNGDKTIIKYVSAK